MIYITHIVPGFVLEYCSCKANGQPDFSYFTLEQVESITAHAPSYNQQVSSYTFWWRWLITVNTMVCESMQNVYVKVKLKNEIYSIKKAVNHCKLKDNLFWIVIDCILRQIQHTKYNGILE